MRFQKLIPVLLLACCALLSLPASSAAQIQPPTGPVIVCVAQPSPLADSHQASFDGGPYVAVTRDVTTDARCPAAAAFSFTLPAGNFTVGAHVILLRAFNPFGMTQGPGYNVEVGLAPGVPTVVGVLPPAPGDGAR